MAENTAVGGREKLIAEGAEIKKTSALSATSAVFR
jgi:hypothetical protein